MTQEIEIPVGDETYHVRPTFRCMSRIEEKVGPVMGLLMAFDNDMRTVKMTDVANIIQIGLATSGHKVDAEKFHKEFMAKGMMYYAPIAGQILMRGLSGKVDAVEDEAGNGDAGTPASD